MSRTKTYSKEFKTQIINLYLAGQSVSELSRSYELNSNTIYSWIQYYKEVLKTVNIDIDLKSLSNKGYSEDDIQLMNLVVELQEQVKIANKRGAAIEALKADIKAKKKSIKELETQRSILEYAEQFLQDKKGS